MRWLSTASLLARAVPTRRDTDAVSPDLWARACWTWQTSTRCVQPSGGVIHTCHDCHRHPQKRLLCLARILLRYSHIVMSSHRASNQPVVANSHELHCTAWALSHSKWKSCYSWCTRTSCSGPRDATCGGGGYTSGTSQPESWWIYASILCLHLTCCL